MSHLDETPRITTALQHIDSADRETWVRVGMAIRAELGEAGFQVWDEWSRTANNYVERDASDVWRSFGDSGPVGLGTLYHLAQEAGWNDSAPRRELSPEEVEARRRSKEEAEARDREDRQRVQAQAARWAAELLAGAPEAPGHDYLGRKKLKPTPTLRLIGVDRVAKLTGWAPKGKAGELQGNLLAARCVRPGSGVAVTLELIDGQGRKAGLPGRGTRTGAFWPTSLPLPKPGEAPTILLAEGVATVLSGTQATGMFGAAALSSSNLINVAQGLRAQYPDAKLIILADLIKATGAPDPHAVEAARAVGGYLAVPDFGPGRKLDQKDLNDLLVLRGPEAVRACIEAAAPVEAKQSEQAQRFRLLGRAEIMEQPDQEWTIKPIFPNRGLVVIHGLSTAGKSFLAFDMGCHVADGLRWFGCRVRQRPVVYVCLEGEAGFKRRVHAWEQHHDRAIPDQLFLVKDRFDIRKPEDVGGLCSIIPTGAVIIIDTLNQASPGAEENGSKDMGEIINGAKEIESRTSGLVVFLAHPGKDESRGIRGHSSLFAALDANVEVAATKDGRFFWSPKKVKDGPAGGEFYFTREVIELGIDEDGDKITSCVIVPDNAPKSSVLRRLNAAEAMALCTFKEAAMAYGRVDQAGSFAGLHLDDWKPYFFNRHTADKQDTKRKAFTRAREGLSEMGLLTVWGDIYRLAGATASHEEHLITEAIHARTESGQPGQDPDMSGNVRPPQTTPETRTDTDTPFRVSGPDVRSGVTRVVEEEL